MFVGCWDTKQCSHKQLILLPGAKSTLDIFCTNRPSFVNQCFPLPGIGDHDAVAVKSTTMLQSAILLMFSTFLQHNVQNNVRTMDDIPYSRIRVITSVCTLRNVRDIFLRKWLLVVLNISVACHNFKTTVRNYSVTRRMPSIAIFAPLMLSFCLGCLLSRVSGNLFSTWEAKLHQVSCQRPVNQVYSVETIM